jgi:RNA polymerase sigma factor (sigma-70 family)
MPFNRGAGTSILWTRTGWIDAIQEENNDDVLQKNLVQAMSQFSPRAVEMLILRYEHDYSDAEIGKLLGTSRGVIAVTMHRARARLKKLLRRSSGEKS